MKIRRFCILTLLIVALILRQMVRIRVVAVYEPELGNLCNEELMKLETDINEIKLNTDGRINDLSFYVMTNQCYFIEDIQLCELQRKDEKAIDNDDMNFESWLFLFDGTQIEQASIVILDDGRNWLKIVFNKTATDKLREITRRFANKGVFVAVLENKIVDMNPIFSSIKNGIIFIGRCLSYEDMVQLVESKQ